MFRNLLRRFARWVLATKPPERLYAIEPQSWYHNSLVDGSVPQLVRIGARFVSAPGSMIIAHDASFTSTTNKVRIEPVEIGDDVYLGAGAIILPGVKIGNRVAIGAGSIVTHDVPDGSVVAGNPARILCTADEYLRKAEADGALYQAGYTPDEWQAQYGKVTPEQVHAFQQKTLAEYKRRHRKQPPVVDRAYDITLRKGG